MKRALLAFASAGVLSTVMAHAKVDLVSLPDRDTVQLTIYNSADLTLARESRALTLKKGENRLQFSWEGTLIDPTSLDMLPKAHASKIDILDLVYPPRVRNLGLWNIQSGVSGNVPMEISYLTSGFSWRAFYTGTLASDESVMRLQGYVRVQNNSGEDYENAQVRLIVGKVNMIDEIAALARRQHPYGSPHAGVVVDSISLNRGRPMKKAALAFKALGNEMVMLEGGSAPKEIRKEGLSEYFLYTIEGTETIRNGWSKRLPSFDVADVPVKNLYKFEQERYGNSVIRFLSFKNDEDHELGDTPIPGGALRVFRSVDDDNALSYEGQSSFKYIPVDEDVELNLGGVQNVIVEPTLMDTRTDEYLFNRSGDIAGWHTIETYKVEVKNTRDVAVKVAITRNVPVRSWDLEPTGDHGEFEKVDLDTVKFTLEMKPRSKQEFGYVLTTRHGTRAD